MVSMSEVVRYATPENFREVMAEVDAAGGGTVVLAPGEYHDPIVVAGNVHLTSGVPPVDHAAPQHSGNNGG